jgi:hypothetical protein
VIDLVLAHRPRLLGPPLHDRHPGSSSSQSPNQASISSSSRQRPEPSAGDCFNAGLLRGSDPPEALALGCAAGAASNHGIGGTGSSPGLTAALALARNVSVRPWP